MFLCIYLGKNWLAIAFRIFRQLPYIKDKINNELDKNVQEMESEIRKQIQGKSYITTLPKLGWKKEEILQEIDQMMALGNIGVCKYYAIPLYTKIFRLNKNSNIPSNFFRVTCE